MLAVKTMPHPTRRTIVRWAGMSLPILLASYVGAYCVLGDRQHTTSIEFKSPTVAAAFLPLAVVESGMRQDDFILMSASEEEIIIWWECDGFSIPEKYTLNPRALDRAIEAILLKSRQDRPPEDTNTD